MDEKKEYKFRELNGSDIFYVSAILDKANLNTDKLASKMQDVKAKNKDKKDADNSELGLIFVMEIFRNIHKCKKEFNDWLADLLSIEKDEVLKIPLVQYGQLLKQLQSIEGLTELFK